jgi:hypothetical protein
MHAPKQAYHHFLVSHLDISTHYRLQIPAYLSLTDLLLAVLKGYLKHAEGLEWNRIPFQRAVLSLQWGLCLPYLLAV